MIYKDQNHIKRSNKTIVGTEKKTQRILLAEDDHDMRGLLAESLQADGYEIVECPNGWSLLKGLRDYLILPSGSQSQEVDLIISDIRMPGVSGLEVLEGLYEVEDCPPIILITAFGDSATHERAERWGVAAIFDKPFDMEELLAKVKGILGPGSLRWERNRCR